MSESVCKPERTVAERRELAEMLHEMGCGEWNLGRVRVDKPDGSYIEAMRERVLPDNEAVHDTRPH